MTSPMGHGARSALSHLEIVAAGAEVAQQRGHHLVEVAAGLGRVGRQPGAWQFFLAAPGPFLAVIGVCRVEKPAC